MIRERTSLHLAVGLVVSMFLHTALIIWGPLLDQAVKGALYPDTDDPKNRRLDANCLITGMSKSQ